jgi:hypothetical protein
MHAQTSQVASVLTVYSAALMPLNHHLKAEVVRVVVLLGYLLHMLCCPALPHHLQSLLHCKASQW